MGHCSFGVRVPASPVRGTGVATPADTTHVVRPCFERLSGRRLHVVTDVVLRGSLPVVDLG